MDRQTEALAKKFGFEKKLKQFDSEILSLPGIIGAEYDLSGFYDNINQIIIIPEYKIPLNLSTYFEFKRNLINKLLLIAESNHLYKSGDPIEDMGEHFYIVLEPNRDWTDEKDCAFDLGKYINSPERI